MRKKIIVLLFLAAFLVTQSGCAHKPELLEITLADDLITMVPNQTVMINLLPSMSDDNPSNEDITSALEQIELVWSSSDRKVATVENGEITAIAPGNTIILMEDADGRFSDSLEITVIVPVENVTVSDVIEIHQRLTPMYNNVVGEDGIMDPGEPIWTSTTMPEFMLVKIYPENATHVIISFASSDDAIVTVSETGTLNGLGEGTAYITTTVESDGLDGRVEQVYQTEITVIEQR